METYSNHAFSIKYQNNKPALIKRSTIAAISPKNCPVIIFTKYNDIDDTVYNSIIKYIKAGGKIILIPPQNAGEDKQFIKLAKLVGVNVEKVTTTSQNNEINWVEKTLTNNNLKSGSRIVKSTLYNEASHLAVFGDIEKHETAISSNHNGVLFAWVWGKDGNSNFNEKSMQYVLSDILPKSYISNDNKTSQSNKTFSAISYSEDINNLNADRKYIQNYQDNIINYSKDLSTAQSKMEMSKVNELLAVYYAKNNNNDDYNKYLQLAKNDLSESTFNVNNLAPAETRGIWFDRGTIVNIKSKSEMGKYFDKLKQSGITTVYLETINAGYAVYPSKYAPQNPLTKGRDILSWAIDEAHARKMKVQAWIWVFAVGNDRHNKIIGKPNDYVGPVLEKHMKWALLGENGNFRPKNQPEFWIDPSDKEGRQYLIDVACEITKKYNVDGIQLDYIRYPFQSNDNLMGFNHNSMEQYSAKTGEKLFQNNYATNIMWNKWKEENINTFVRKISANTKNIRKDLKISAAIFSKPQANRLNTIQQNYENWINNSYIDFLTPMSYSTSVEALNNNLSCLMPQNEGCLIYPGVALKHVNQTGLLKQITSIREHGFPGVSFFAVAQLDNEKMRMMKNALYSDNTLEPTYNVLKSANLLLSDYKTTLQTLKTTNYELSINQKAEIDSLINQTDRAISQVNSNQYKTAISTIQNLINKNDNFFSGMFKYNILKRNAPKSYLKRAINLLKVYEKKTK
ncbi:MAG: family 10 glycosylhydrolase [Candidatus Gastranaerophilales bacterium]|nr:family 10 glycosylhydrolase [Candidatus Gastranaerophilales bacterium]